MVVLFGCGLAPFDMYLILWIFVEYQSVSIAYNVLFLFLPVLTFLIPVYTKMGRYTSVITITASAVLFLVGQIELGLIMLIAAGWSLNQFVFVKLLRVSSPMVSFLSLISVCFYALFVIVFSTEKITLKWSGYIIDTAQWSLILALAFFITVLAGYFFIHKRDIENKLFHINLMKNKK